MGSAFDEKNFDCANSFLNNEKGLVNCETQIGFTTEYYHQYIFVILSTIGIVLDLILFIDFFLHKLQKYKSNSYGSMRLLFRTITILDFLSSLYYLISSTALFHAKNIKENALCKPLSLFYVFLFIFNLYFISCTLKHFRKLNFDPINSIYKRKHSLINYLITGFILSLVVTLLALFLGVLGKSPMNTCFINTELNSASFVIYGIGLLIIIYIIYQIVHGLFFSKMFVNDIKMKELYIQNSLYTLIVCLMNIPMMILFIITNIRKQPINDSDISLKLFSYFSTIILFITPSLSGCLSIYQGAIKLNCCENKNKKSLSNSSNILNLNFSSTLSLDDQYDWLDKHAMKSFMKNILLGIAISIQKSKEIKIPNTLDKVDFEESVKYEVNFKNYEDYGIENYDVKEDDYLNVNIVEYAPKCFCYLRQLEDINLNDMVKSFLPSNNREGMRKSAGKSGSFFISTDNQEYMIKTLKKDEFELIKKSFLKEYIKYIKKNPNSLICRIYGMYSLAQYGGTEVFVIVMRNVIGSLKNNIVAKFDLKGSTINRELKELDMSKIDNGVMKDVNFNDIEFGILVNNDNILKINFTAQNDSTFLASMDLMDYSLFVVKLSLNKEESTEIFGEGIQEKIEKDYNDLITNRTIIVNNIKNKLMNDTDYTIYTTNTKNSINIDEENNKYKYYKKYLFPGLNIGTAYIISIIDFLQGYNFSKIVENKFKTKIKGNKGDNEGGISCIEPKQYSERFINYVKHLTEVKHILTGNQGYKM